MLKLEKCFKPYYNWNTFNTSRNHSLQSYDYSFKPYYNWNTFNTEYNNYCKRRCIVLNLIITGIPSIPKRNCKQKRKCKKGFKPYYNWNTFNTVEERNLIRFVCYIGFKPYYNWNTFNTEKIFISKRMLLLVLNLIITGIPSIRWSRRLL